MTIEQAYRKTLRYRREHHYHFMRFGGRFIESFDCGVTQWLAM
jgi:hypothetical protein